LRWRRHANVLLLLLYCWHPSLLLLRLLLLCLLLLCLLLLRLLLLRLLLLRLLLLCLLFLPPSTEHAHQLHCHQVDVLLLGLTDGHTDRAVHHQCAQGRQQGLQASCSRGTGCCWGSSRALLAWLLCTSSSGSTCWSSCAICRQL
jgi:hypothetical protein